MSADFDNLDFVLITKTKLSRQHSLHCKGFRKPKPCKGRLGVPTEGSRVVSRTYLDGLAVTNTSSEQHLKHDIGLQSGQPVSNAKR